MRESSLASIWNGERMVALRRKIASRDISGPAACAHYDRL